MKIKDLAMYSVVSMTLLLTTIGCDINSPAKRELQHEADSLLNVARQEHDAQHEWVMSHATELNDHSPEVLRLNSLRQRRDSLQVEFERQAQKVKFYMSKSAK